MKTWYNDATTNFQTFRKTIVVEGATGTNKHTPGPWEHGRMLLPPKSKDRRCGFVVNGPDVTDDLPTRICDLRVPRGIDGFAEGEANARLIAAAPELLSALEAMVEMFESHITGKPGPDDAAERWDRARDAVSKAKGCLMTLKRD
jgi:hypothetical protein